MSDVNFQTLVGVVVKAEQEGYPRHELTLDICATSSTLVSLGFPALRLIVKAKTIGKMFFEHGLTQTQIEKIPHMIECPMRIFQSDTQPGNVVVFTYEVKGSSPIIIPIAPKRQIGRGTWCNEVVSMYAKTGPDPTARWKSAGLLLWEDRKR